MHNISFRRVFIICLALACGMETTAFAGHRVSAQAALFSNSTRHVRYYGKNVHKRVKPASTVKVMTALLVLEHLPLDKVVTISARPSRVQPSKINIRAGEKYRVRDLLYALLLNSANDAAVALAEAVAGSEAEFVRMMNRRARKLGSRHTKFVNANGLPSKKGVQYTTPYDMYLIFRAALKQEFFRSAIKKRHKNIYSLSGRKIALKSHNKILFKDWRYMVYGKTGWTVKAGQCFVGYIMKGNNICIISLFDSDKRWEDIRYIISKYGKIPI